MRILPLFILLTVGLMGCGEDPTTPDYASDPISGLTATATTPYSVRLDWTAPSVEGLRATEYEIRYREGSFDADDWDDATAVEHPPLPDAPDEPEAYSANGLPPNATLVFRIRHGLNGWISAPSNAADVDMPAAAPLPDGFLFMPAGTYTLGSPLDERGREDDEIQHDVTLTGALFVSRCEITQTEYEELMDANPSRFEGPDQPVEQVTWYDAVAYCNARSLAEDLTPVYEISGTSVSWIADADGYRLPTEAEWEVACRAGSGDAFCSGGISEVGCAPDPSLTMVAIYCAIDVDEDDGASSDENGPDGPADVGQLFANDWGLKDMHGNVFEWCWDRYTDSYHDNAPDPTGPETGVTRIIRGGCWSSPVEACRSASRSTLGPAQTSYGVGFRVVRRAG